MDSDSLTEKNNNRRQTRRVTCTSCTRLRRHVNSWLNVSRVQFRELCVVIPCVNISARVDQKCPTLLQSGNTCVQKAERTRRNLARGNFGKQSTQASSSTSVLTCKIQPKNYVESQISTSKVSLLQEKV